MAKKARFTPAKCVSGWRVNIPAKYSETGKRQQLFYATRELAKAARDEFLEKVETFGTQARAISPTLAEQATAADALLKPYGLTVLEAAQQVLSQEKAKAASVTIGAALDEFEKAKEIRSDKHVQAITHMAKHLREAFTGRIMSTITGKEIEDHIEAHTSGPAAFNAKVRLHGNFWRWCSNPRRGWCVSDVLARIDRKDEKPGETETLTAAQAKALMEAAETYLPDCVVPFAIGLFTGMRPAEIKRLAPSDITADGIAVTAVNDRKNKSRRYIQMPATFAAWLREYPVGESVCPPNFFRKEKAVRRLAGFGVWSDYVAAMNFDPPIPAEPDDDDPKWPHNALRHTAASVAVALDKPLSILLFEHGHTGGEETLRKHYVGKMTKKDALAIEALVPKSSASPIK